MSHLCKELRRDGCPLPFRKNKTKNNHLEALKFGGRRACSCHFLGETLSIADTCGIENRCASWRVLLSWVGVPVCHIP